jgi:hypothetical protein
MLCLSLLVYNEIKKAEVKEPLKEYKPVWEMDKKTSQADLETWRHIPDFDGDELDDASESDSDPGEDTLVEEDLGQVIPAKLIQYLIKAGLL